MEHYNFELKDSFDKMDYINYVDKAKEQISLKNGKENIDFELVGNFNRPYNGHIGVLEEFRVLSSNKTIGFLECFRTNNSDYLSIYTSNVNLTE